MVRLDKVIKPWKESAALNDHINLYGFWNKTTFLTKSGDVGMILSVPGVDYESLDRSEQDYAVKRLEAALKAFGPGFHVYLSQATFGGGVGRYLKNSNLACISLVAGLAGQNTQYHQKIASQNVTSSLFVANLQFFRFNKTNGDFSAVLLPVISEPGRVKFDMNAKYYVKLTGNLSWNVSVYGSWDNRPPNGLSSSDYGSSSGLSWTFGNR